MKNYKISFLLIAILCYFSLAGCHIQGLTSGYKRLSQQQKDSIHSTANMPKDSIKNGQLYNITGAKLRQWLKNDAHSLVYIWVPHCNGSHCYSLQAFTSYATERNLKLYIVADSYEMGDISNQLSAAYPVYIIDAGAYHSSLRNTYRKAFVKELVGSNQLPDSVLHAGNLFFNHDTLQTARLDLYK